MSARQSVVPGRSPWPIVSVGRDRALLMSRQEALAQRGIRVQSMAPEQAEFPAHDGRPRLWVLCGSVEEASLVYLACTVRRHSAASRLFLVEWLKPAGPERCLFHRVLDHNAGEDALAEAIRSGWKTTASGLGD